MRSLKTIFGLRRVAWRAATMWFELQIVHHRLKTGGLKAVPSEVPIAPTRLADQNAILRSYRIATAFSPWTTCLRRAIVLNRQLRAAGYPSVLKQGARKDGKGRLEMHAWVELSGQVIADSSQFIETFEEIALPWAG